MRPNFRPQNHAFSFVELMIAGLIFSALGLSISIYLKQNQTQLSTSDASEELRSASRVIEKVLKDQFQQIAFINPICDTNAPTGVASVALCSNLKVFSGVIPYPGKQQSHMQAASDFALPGTLETGDSTLDSSNDAIRFAQFDFEAGFNCPLDPSVTDNPSTSSHLLYADPSCLGQLENNRLYVLVQDFNGVQYSNVFQITALTESTNVEIQYNESTSIYNQIDTLGESGFNSSARIYPIYFVDYAVDPDKGLMTREIRPSSSDLTGMNSNWVRLYKEVEGMQFEYLTVLTSGVDLHTRTMDFVADESGDGVEDIKGVIPRLIIKSKTPSKGIEGNDNPLTLAFENDEYKRFDQKFFVMLKNTQ